ncbi:polysaccharide biosynthesis/export family protein [Marinoscillum furvescens]|uniref:Polysaccharide export outer membrane protein n=1 Tax=Marinoscillum furvescens DSM 4134 TaxID=1122208 RepID=A0A3D9KX46_MARFU|nr:polysaccharide biosynthesis/export family protein [Marinoscillum furvescens]RED92847.1 polysaccharide export outer membrane protein [Marinoscillum furvescens DSM 4134]
MNEHFFDLKHLSVLLAVLLMSLSGCKLYRQDILFQLDDDFTAEQLSEPVAAAAGNYVLRAGDYLDLRVYTNKGERVIDPNNELMQGMNRQQNQQNGRIEYLIQQNGVAKLPMVGDVKLVGLTVVEAERMLEQAFDTYYQESFVKLKVNNRRVTVLGVNGGVVVPLDNENTTLAEVLALYGGLDLGAKAKNIKLLRGDLSDPQVYEIDLTTISGMKASVIAVRPGDVIYVEPWRRPVFESIRDVSPLIGIVSGVITLILVIQNLTK